MKEEVKVKGYDVETKVWVGTENNGKFDRETTTFDNVKAAFVYANKFNNDHADMPKDFVEIWVYDNASDREVYTKINGKERFGSGLIIDRSAEQTDYKAIIEEIRNVAEITETQSEAVATTAMDAAIETSDEEKVIEAVTAVNKNYESGVYKWYYKVFKTPAAAFKYLWKKSRKYAETTEFILQVIADGDKVLFNFDSAAKEYDLEINDAEIKKLYEEEQTKTDVKVALSEIQNFVKLSKNSEWFAKHQKDLMKRRIWKAKFEIQKSTRQMEDILAQQAASVSEPEMEIAAASETSITKAAVAEIKEIPTSISTEELETPTAKLQGEISMEIKNFDFDIVTEFSNANANVDAALQILNVNREKICELTKHIDSYGKVIQAYVEEILSPLLWEVERHFNFITQDGRKLDAWEHMYFGTIISVNQKNFPYNPTGEYRYYIGAADSAGTYATYKNLDTFKRVINELAETIRNGGTEYKFPADKKA